MKRFGILVLTMLFMPLAAMATTNFVWTRGLEGGWNGKCVVADAAGNVIAAGNSGLLVKYNPAGDLIWMRQGTNANVCNAMAIDQSGSLYVAGYFLAPSNTFEGITITNKGATNLFLAKFDADGHILWAKTVVSTNTAGTSAGNGVAVDSDGNVYLTGTFANSVSFDGVTMTNAPSGTSFFLAKYDGSGTLAWVKNGGKAQANSVAVDLAGNVFLTGYYAGNVVLGGIQFTNHGPNQNYEVFVMKSDSQGDVLWARQGGGLNNDVGVGVGVDQGGCAYITGTFENAAGFGEFGVVEQPAVGGVAAYPGDVFIVKYDSEGRVLWARSYGSQITDGARSIAVDAAGNSYITGGTNMVVIAGYDSSGILDDIKTAANGSGNRGEGIVSDGLGNIYVTGSLVASANQVFGSDVLTNSTFFLTKLQVFEPTNAPVFTSDITNQTLIVTSNYLFSVGVSSVSPLSYQWQFNGVDIPQATNSLFELTNVSFGNAGLYSVIVSNIYGASTSKVANVQVEFPQELVWARQAGGFRIDEGRASLVDENGNVYVAGTFQHRANFGATILTNSVLLTAVSDVFLAKYDPAGDLLWVQQAGGTNADGAFSLAMDNDGNVYLGGAYAGTANFGNVTLTNINASTSSGFLAKYDADGNVLWAQRTGLVIGMAVDNTNGVYAVGRMLMPGPTPFGTNTVGGPYTFLAKADTEGNFEWVKTISGSPFPWGASLSTDASNNVLVAGYFTGTADFGTNTLTATTSQTSHGFLAKYSPVGDVLWVQKVLTAFSTVLSMAKDEADNIFLTGWYKPNTAGEPSVKFAGVPLLDTGRTNLCLLKYDASGNQVWGLGVGGTNDFAYCVGTSLATDGHGNVYVTGTNTGATRFNREIVVKPGGFVGKYGTGGNLLWARAAGKETISVAQGGTNAYVTGSFVFSENFGITNLVTGSSNDVFVAKLGINPPNIVVQLTNQWVVTGSNTTLQVTVKGTGPLSYQWLFNNVPIAGATASTLTLTNVHVGSEGSYGVLVSNPLGTVKNLGAVLVIPVMNAPRVEGTNLVISWEDAFDLQVSTNGVVGPYYDVPGATSPLTNSTEAGAQFYRLVR